MSARGAMITVIATELANAVAIDNDHPDGHDISAGIFGTAVSALIRKRVDEYTSLAAERDAAHRLNGDQVASNLGLRVRMAALEALLGRAATAMQHLGCRQDDPLLTEIRASCQTPMESKQRPLNAEERATVEKYLADGRWERACAERLKDLEENPVNTADEPL